MAASASTYVPTLLQPGAGLAPIPELTAFMNGFDGPAPRVDRGLRPPDPSGLVSTEPPAGFASEPGATHGLLARLRHR